MALLHYHNLGVHRPDVLMQRAFFGLKTFYDFLRKTKDCMEDDSAVKRLAWVESYGPVVFEGDEHPNGFWIQLIEPLDRPNEPEATFRKFLDENVSVLFEAPGSDREGRGLPGGSRHDFGEEDHR